MQKINWDMMTQFVFPEQLGLVEEVISCDITPRWQQVETEDSIQLNGIYHITAVAKFNPYEIPQYSDGTLIEELEFDGNNGYFEYALPLNIDLPRDKVAPHSKPELHIEDVSYFVYDGCSCTFKWDVKCSFEEPVEGALFQHEPIPETPIVNDYRTEQTREFTEEIRFGHDAIFPEAPTNDVTPSLEVESAPNEGQPLQDVPEYENSEDSEPLQNLTPVQNAIQEEEVAPIQEMSVQEMVPASEPQVQQEAQSVEKVQEVDEWVEEVESTSLNMATDVIVDEGMVIEDIDKKKIVEEPAKREKVVYSNQYFPTDTDEFYNELTESYTILNISNKIRNE
ncbi:hypothetical protein [Lysinibacillus sp. BW-2-10]|uniref:hypothetical protein n=1 Tax=Lysinibacillus sp. BW-2-10 TaxID=2590030 RepID=UPI00117CAE4A|nr:hypothetical protein [Lysinibacillus sp. BW-2-10]TSI03216.1 hypothetical protein FJQ64_17055 [Lysinibacillus sp. BW-2-10]